MPLFFTVYFSKLPNPYEKRGKSNKVPQIESNEQLR